MTTRLRRLLPAALVLAFAATAATVPAPRADEIDDAMQLGVDYMVSIQGTYPGRNRVNPGPPGTTVMAPAIPHVWEWQVGSGLVYSNTWGPSALGTVAAAGMLPDGAAGAAVAAYAESLVADFNDVGTFMRSETLPYGVDVELLGRLGGGGVRGCTSTRLPPALRRDNSRRSAYSAAAEDWLSNYASGADAADRIIDGRTAGANDDLAGWDVSLMIRAGIAAGDLDFACDAAERVLDRRPDWEDQSPAYITDWWGPASDAGLAHALSLLDATGACGDFSAEVRDYRDRVHARQSLTSDGGPYTGVDQHGAILGTFSGFDYPATQLTSYGVLAFIGCGRDATSEDLAAASRALGFLVRAQYPAGTGAVITDPAVDPRPADGGWAPYPTFWQDSSFGEINGEALLALAVGARAGLTAAPLPASTASSADASGLASLSATGEREWQGTLGRVPDGPAPIVRAQHEVTPGPTPAWLPRRLPTRR